jgi:signal transduction histidine kinase
MVGRENARRPATGPVSDRAVEDPTHTSVAYCGDISVFRILGSGPQAAARQAAALFLLAGALALLEIRNEPGNLHRLLIVAGCDFGTGLLGLLVPWRRSGPALLGLLGFAVLGFSTWSFGGVATGTGPFLVLLYAWAALHFPRWILAAYALPAAASYVTPLLLTHQPPVVVGSAFILMPVALAVAFLIEGQARNLREDRERLERIEQWRVAMIGTLAHDVRAPLTTVQMALEELREQVPEPGMWMLDSALRQTARMTRLAENLLDVHRIDSVGHLKLDRQLVPARRLVEDALSYVRSAPVVADIDDDLTIWVDPARFEQIIVNLVGNAVKYGRPPIVVRVTADRLEVRDHGTGIPDALRSKLFSQFAAGGADGVGLGLWIVRQLAEAHGGRAVAEARSPGVAMVVTFAPK